MMQIHIQNDGPVTLEIESPRRTNESNGDEWEMLQFIFRINKIQCLPSPVTAFVCKKLDHYLGAANCKSTIIIIFNCW